VIVAGESSAAAIAPAADMGGQPAMSRGANKVVMPGSHEAISWREQTERLLAAQLERRKAIREIFAPLQAEDEQLVASIKALRRVLSEVEVGDAPSGAAPTPNRKRWSRLYDRCQNPECRTPEARHSDHGFCVNRAARRRKAAGQTGSGGEGADA
jgi:hypothetical protein